MPELYTKRVVRRYVRWEDLGAGGCGESYGASGGMIWNEDLDAVIRSCAHQEIDGVRCWVVFLVL